MPMPPLIAALLLTGGALLGQDTRPATSQPATLPTIAEIRALRAADRLDEATTLLDQITAAEPGRGDAWFELAVTLRAADHLERAVAAFAKAAEHHRFRAEAFARLAGTQARLGRLDAAFEALEQAMDAGYRDAGRIEQAADLRPLRADERFTAVISGLDTRRAARDVLGAWAMGTELDGQTIEATMTLRVRRGRLEGTWSSMGREMTLDDVAFGEGALRFVRHVDDAALRFDGTVADGVIEGRYAGEDGDLACRGERLAPGIARRLGPRHGRPIVRREGRTLLWAKGDPEGTDAEWFDMTAALVDPAEFQFGIGKDRIPSIDAPTFVAPGDPRLATAGIDEDTVVIGFAAEGVAKAYPVFVLDRHEVVNDEFQGVPFAVCW